MDMILLDEDKKFIWYVSFLVCLRFVCFFDFSQSVYFFEYMDSVGGVCVDLGWFENIDEYFIVRLDIYFSVVKL